MESDRNQDLEDVRQLWAGRFQGVLSTQSLAEPGYPFGSLVPYCLDETGLPLFLFSHLAQHCKNLEADRRCAFTIAEPVAGDVQQGLRLTCVGDCSQAPPDDRGAASRYFRYFPQARAYFEQLNFRLYRLVPRRFHFNGGFATARWLGTDRVLRASTISTADETQLIEQVEKTETRILERLAGTKPRNQAPRITGVDAWGIDVAFGDRLKRIPFPQRLDAAGGLGAFLRERAGENTMNDQW